jgi:hypothetical protein
MDIRPTSSHCPYRPSDSPLHSLGLARNQSGIVALRPRAVPKAGPTAVPTVQTNSSGAISLGHRQPRGWPDPSPGDTTAGAPSPMDVNRNATQPVPA